MARLLKDQPVGPWGHHVKKDCQGLLIALTPLKINPWFKRRFPSWKPITFRWTHSFFVQSTRARVVIAGKVWIASTYSKLCTSSWGWLFALFRTLDSTYSTLATIFWQGICLEAMKSFPRHQRIQGDSLSSGPIFQRIWGPQDPRKTDTPSPKPQYLIALVTYLVRSVGKVISKFWWLYTIIYPSKL